MVNVAANSGHRSCDRLAATLAVLVAFLAIRPVTAPVLAFAAEPADAASGNVWDIENPPGPSFQQPIDTREGTWINLDVHPNGQEIVFDLLGDLYIMPITGADGNVGGYPRKLTSGAAWDMQPRYSPDGQTISFTSDRRGKSERSGDNIWLIPSAGGEPTQVTNETFRLVNGACWSPDGQYLAARKHFTGRRSLGTGEIWLYHRQALAAQAMTGQPLTTRPNEQKDVNEPAFSPDGRYLYYAQDTTSGDLFEYDKDSNKQIYVIKRVELTTGETEDFVTGQGGACRPTPSRDGKHLAFVRRIDGKTGLFVMELASGSVRLVTDQLERDMQEAWAIHGVYPAFQWTPDNRHIVIWAQGQIRNVNVADGSFTTIPFHVRDERRMTQAVRSPIRIAGDTFPVRMLRWVVPSPDGNQVAFQALGKIYLRDLPDGAPRRLTTQEHHFEFCPSYSRDGRFLVYSTWHDGELGSVRVASVASADAQESWKVTAEPGHYLEPAFHPDGSRVVYVKAGGGHLLSPLWSRDPGIYITGIHGGTPLRLRDRGESPHFGDDPERVFFTVSTPGKDADNLGLYSIDLNGHEFRQHYNSQWGTEYRLSPNGKWLAFAERFHVYLTPFVAAGRTIEIGPGASNLPTRKLSTEAGGSLQFAGDGRALHWSLGPQWYSLPLGNDPMTEDSAAVPTARDLGFAVPTAQPTGTTAFVGGRIVTMGPQGTIDNGTIVVKGNRIAAVGPRNEVTIPDDAEIVPIPGLVVLPGLIDVHAHGAQGENGMIPRASWVNCAQLAFGITTIHDPSNDTATIFAASEMAQAGEILAPRIFSTGTILYGAAGSYKAEVDSLDDARFHLRRMQAVGAFTVKSYNQPRRDQRQQVLAAARELGMMVVPEGGSTFMHNMTMIVDGHTGIEHTLPVQSIYDDVRDLWRGTNVGYTPTLSVAYGGISGERYWYEIDDLFRHPRLIHFLPPQFLQPRARRRQKAPLDEYNHIRVAQIARDVVADGGLVQAGGHGQLNGICTHWELWSFVQGGMSAMDALRCGTLNGAKYLGLDQDLGSLEPGKLADLIVIARGHDPTQDIRATQFVELVMLNGRLLAASTLEEMTGDKRAAPHFFFHDQPFTGGLTSLRAAGCDCTRPNSPAFWRQSLQTSP